MVHRGQEEDEALVEDSGPKEGGKPPGRLADLRYVGAGGSAPMLCARVDLGRRVPMAKRVVAVFAWEPAPHLAHDGIVRQDHRGRVAARAGYRSGWIGPPVAANVGSRNFRR